MNYSLLGSSVHGILHTRILEWVAIPFSRGLPDPGMKARSPALQVGSLPSEPPGKPSNPRVIEWNQLDLQIYLVQFCVSTELKGEVFANIHSRVLKPLRMLGSTFSRIQTGFVRGTTD